MKKLICILLSFMFVITLTCCEKVVYSDSKNESFVDTDTSEMAIPTITPPKDTTIKLSFAGDMILACQLDSTTAGSFNEYTNKYPASYFLQEVKPVFDADDFTIVNLENVLTDRALTPITKDYDPAFWFKAKASNIEILTAGGVEAVSLNNNHTMDYGQAGYDDTRATAINAGLTVGDKNGIMYLEKEDFKIAVVCVGLWGSYSTSSALNLLEQAKQQSDYQVILFHGGTEKLHTPEQWKIIAAHTLADNGADLIVGGHPHVLQPREVYNGVEIVYSIGNFCYGGARRPENATIIYQMTLTVGQDKTVKSQISEMIPCYVYTGSVNNYQPALIEDGAAKQQVLDFMDGKINSPV